MSLLHGILGIKPSEWISIAIQFLTLVAIIFYTRYSKRQWVEMRKTSETSAAAASVARQQLEQSSQPLVLLESIDPIQLATRGPLPESTVLHFKNEGSGTAFGTAVLYRCLLLTAADFKPGRNFIDEGGWESTGQIILGPGQRWDVPCSLQPAGGPLIRSEDITDGWIRTPPTGVPFIQKGPFLFIASQVRFEDIFGRDFEVNFENCLWPDGTWRAQGGRHTSRMRISDWRDQQGGDWQWQPP
jgi:hypothetical protein